jgi:hypothetical protein
MARPNCRAGHAVAVELWSSALYGGLCRECGFARCVDVAQARDIVVGAPDKYSALLAGGNGTEQHRDLSWTAGS